MMWLALALACGVQGDSELRRAVRIADAVRVGTTVEAAAAAEGLTPAQLDGLLYEIAADPARAAAYAAALEDEH